MRSSFTLLGALICAVASAQSSLIFLESFETGGTPSLSPQWVWSGNAPVAVVDCDGGWGVRKDVPIPGEPNDPYQPIRWLFHPLPHDSLVNYNVTARSVVPPVISSAPHFVHATICWFNVNTGTPVDWNFNNGVSASEFCDPFVTGISTPPLASDPQAQFGVLIYGERSPLTSIGHYDLAEVRVETYERRAMFTGTVMLGGAYDTGTQQMRADLNLQGLIPLVEPYTALGYPQVNGGGNETTTPNVLSANYPAGRVVDWVRLELRAFSDPTQLVATRQALVLQNGQIVSTTGQFGILFDVLHGNYFVVVRHRNHLGAMTSTPITVPFPGGGIWSYLFATPGFSCYGTNPRNVQGNVALLWPGDVTTDHVVKYTGTGNDRDPILTAIGGTVPTNTITGQYRMEDVNLDGVVKYTGSVNDRDIILQTVGGTVPTNVRVEQVP
ncbi:MAG: hypothetical protein IPG74_09465 [Flavobacteriales bacterium]|nr:hypothetical protein [Flavobacteriales bacterium]MBK9196848.1 hypothetical protein [Flavobacteriales bacterium]